MAGWTATAALITFLSLLAAVVAIRHARDSVRAAEARVKPMQEMATNLAATVEKLTAMQDSMAATAETMEANLTLANEAYRRLKAASASYP